MPSDLENAFNIYAEDFVTRLGFSVRRRKMTPERERLNRSTLQVHDVADDERYQAAWEGLLNRWVLVPGEFGRFTPQSLVLWVHLVRQEDWRVLEAARRLGAISRQDAALCGVEFEVWTNRAAVKFVNMCGFCLQKDLDLHERGSKRSRPT